MQCQEAFEKLKVAVANEPILKLPNFESLFKVHTDASNRAIGGVLVQEGHLVAFKSQKLNDAKQRYSIHEKEMLVVVHCLMVWRMYLLGTKFIIRTDNVANTYFHTQKNLSPKQARWREFLQEYDFTWEHKPGWHNQVIDTISRREVHKYVATFMSIQSSLVEKLRKAVAQDVAYMKLIQVVNDGVVQRYWLKDGVANG